MLVICVLEFIIMWNEIKKILQNVGGRCIIIENNKPSYVVSTFEDYQSLVDNSDKELEKVNKEISASVGEEFAESEDKKEIKIENLPF